MEHTLSINPQVYDLPTIKAAAYTFTDKAYIIIDKEEDNFTVRLVPKGDQENLKEEFHNQLVNYAHFNQSMINQKDAVKLIVERAMFSANPSLIDEAEEKEIEKLLSELKNDA